MSVNAVVLEIVIGDRQAAIVVSAMVGKLDLDAVEHSSGRQRE